METENDTQITAANQHVMNTLTYATCNLKAVASDGVRCCCREVKNSMMATLLLLNVSVDNK